MSCEALSSDSWFSHMCFATSTILAAPPRDLSAAMTHSRNSVRDAIKFHLRQCIFSSELSKNRRLESGFACAETIEHAGLKPSHLKNPPPPAPHTAESAAPATRLPAWQKCWPDGFPLSGTRVKGRGRRSGPQQSGPAPRAHARTAGQRVHAPGGRTGCVHVIGHGGARRFAGLQAAVRR